MVKILLSRGITLQRLTVTERQNDALQKDQNRTLYIMSDCWLTCMFHVFRAPNMSLTTIITSDICIKIPDCVSLFQLNFTQSSLNKMVFHLLWMGSVVGWLCGTLSCLCLSLCVRCQCQSVSGYDGPSAIVIALSRILIRLWHHQGTIKKNDFKIWLTLKHSGVFKHILLF